MKRLALFLLSLAIAAPLGATAQAPDIIRIGGKEYGLHSNPLAPVADTLLARLPEPEVVSTGLWRGYIATFAVRNGHLYLDDVRVLVAGEERFRSVMKGLFDAPPVVSWYTGNLVVPTGEPVDYVHMGYASTYSSYVVLTVVKGAVRKQRKLNAEEFAKFRRAQYQAWKKTPGYAEMLAETKKTADSLDDKMIEDFIFQFASGEYLAKIFD